MALLAMDGLDVYDDKAAVLAAGWAITAEDTGSNFTYEATGGRFGGGALKGVLDINGWEMTIPGGIAESATVIIQFAYFFLTNDGNEEIIFLIETAGSPAMRLAMNNDQSLDLKNRAGADVATSAAAVMTANTLHYFEIKCTNSISAACIINLNGVEIFNVTGQDFRTGSNNYTHVRFSGVDAATADWRIDDPIIMDTTGSFNNDFIGDVQIETLNVDADGGVVAWTRNAGANDWEAIDEAIQASDGDTTYVSSNTATPEGRYGFANMTASPSTVPVLQVRSLAKIASADSTTYRDLINSNANEAVGGTITPTTGYVWDIDQGLSLFDSNPDGVVAWTESAINALQAGTEIVAGSTQEIRVTSMFLEVGFTSAAPDPVLGVGARYSGRIGM